MEKFEHAILDAVKLVYDLEGRVKILEEEKQNEKDNKAIIKVVKAVDFGTNVYRVEEVEVDCLSECSYNKEIEKKMRKVVEDALQKHKKYEVENFLESISEGIKKLGY